MTLDKRKYDASSQDIIKRYQQDNTKTKIAWKILEKTKAQNEVVMRTIDSKYSDMIDKLQSKKSKEIDKIDDETARAEKKTSELCRVLKESEIRVNRIIYFLLKQNSDMDASVLNQVRPSGSGSDKKYMEELERYTDEITEIRLYIVENDRPKNKYSLAIAGISKIAGWRNNVWKYPRNSNPLSVPGTDCIEDEYGVFYSIQKARKYHETHDIKKLMGNYFTEYKAVKAEFHGVCKKFTYEDFEEVLDQRYRKYWDDTHSDMQEELLRKLGIRTSDITHLSKKDFKKMMQSEWDSFQSHLMEDYDR